MRGLKLLRKKTIKDLILKTIKFVLSEYYLSFRSLQLLPSVAWWSFSEEVYARFWPTRTPAEESKQRLQEPEKWRIPQENSPWNQLSWPHRSLQRLKQQSRRLYGSVICIYVMIVCLGLSVGHLTIKSKGCLWLFYLLVKPFSSYQIVLFKHLRGCLDLLQNDMLCLVDIPVIPILLWRETE